ncbi:MAG: hypothetical protein WCL61_01620, partial [bacterium]
MKKIAQYLIPFLLLIGFFTIINPIFAVEPIDAFKTASGLAGTGQNTNELTTIIINIINWALGFLAIILVLLILWAGWNWMTAMDDEDKIKKAKSTITAAVIGMVIILSAYAIVSFIINSA